MILTEFTFKFFYVPVLSIYVYETWYLRLNQLYFYYLTTHENRQFLFLFSIRRTGTTFRYEFNELSP